MDPLHRDGKAAQARSGGRRPSPSVPGPAAAAVVGLLCAVLAMVLVRLGERGCDTVRSTPACGGAGVVLLAVTAAVTLLAGWRMLQLLRVADAGLSNLLGFALFVIVLMTALLDDVFSAYTWIAPPVLGATTYATGAWTSARLARLSNR